MTTQSSLERSPQRKSFGLVSLLCFMLLAACTSTGNSGASTTSSTGSVAHPEREKVMESGDASKNVLGLGLSLIPNNETYISKFTNYCSNNKAILESNLKDTSFDVKLDGKTIPYTSIRRAKDGLSKNNVCLNFYYPLENQKIGNHVITWDFSFDKRLDDGMASYAPGEEWADMEEQKFIILPSATNSTDFKNWPVVLREDFSRKQVYLYEGEFDGDDNRGREIVSDGKYSIVIDEQKNDRGFFMYPFVSSFADKEYVSINAKSSYEKDNGYYCYELAISSTGLEKRYPAYAFQICSDQGESYTMVNKFPDGDNTVEIIAAVYPSPKINMSRYNKLSVLREGSHYKFFLNDMVIGETNITDFEHAGYSVGFVAHPGDSLQADFDDLVVQMPVEK